MYDKRWSFAIGDMSSFEDLTLAYKNSVEDEGAKRLLELSNLIIKAQRLEANTNVGRASTRDHHHRQVLKAWQEINAKRSDLESLVHGKLFRLIRDMHAIEEHRKTAKKYEADLVLRAGIVISIGKGKTTYDETFALLAAWSAPVLLDEY